MGTSSIYNGPKDGNPLLPKGFEEEYENDKEDLKQDDREVPGLWKETKTAMSQYINGTSTDKGRVLRNHVKALGGSKAAARQAVSGKNATVRLGAILSSIASVGILNTLESLKINHVGKSIKTLLSEMVNIISSTSNTKEDIISRTATIEAMSDIYKYIEENDMEIECLDRMNEPMFNEIMCAFISNYIFEKMLNDLQSRIEKYADNSQEALLKENEFKDYIRVSVDVKIDEVEFNQLDYDSPNVNEMIGNIYMECYEMLEAYI